MQTQTNTQSIVPGLIQRQISLADKNWFRTGGPANYYAEPSNAQEFAQAISFAKEERLELFILGHGANILISDDGFPGLVIKPNLQEISTHIEQDRAFVTVGAGVGMPELIVHCLENNITGLEEFSGIPGTVGGSVYINLHYFEFLLEQFLHSAQVINKFTGVIENVEPSWFNFGYNQSKLIDSPYYLVCATFKLKKVSDIQTAYAQGRRTEIIRHRLSRYPASHTCGSFFRNFLPHEVTVESNNKKMIYVAYYLDKIGVKGQLCVGDAIVSHQHANMLVNRGKATSVDLITLARTMQQLVKDTYGIVPQPECRLIGFKEYPLLKD